VARRELTLKTKLTVCLLAEDDTVRVGCAPPPLVSGPALCSSEACFEAGVLSCRTTKRSPIPCIMPRVLQVRQDSARMLPILRDGCVIFVTAGEKPVQSFTPRLIYRFCAVSMFVTPCISCATMKILLCTRLKRKSFLSSGVNAELRF
jgi:hypothetical protein